MEIFKQQSLEQLGLWDKALVILVSDHGESLGDHGESSHGYFIYESTLHVPLIVHWPVGEEGRAERVTDPVGLIDVAPTVLDFLHFPEPASFEGSSLLGSRAGAGVYGESMHARDAFGWAALRSMRVGPFKYIDAPRPELYNLQTDPHELANLYVKGSAKAAELRGLMGKLLTRYAPKKNGPAPQASPGARALLDSLGYLSSGPKAPRVREWIRRTGCRSFGCMRMRSCSFIIGRLRWRLLRCGRYCYVIRRILWPRRDLASSYVETGQYAKARDAFAQVLALAPDDYMTNYELGFAEERLGLLKEAKGHLETASRVAPDSKQARKELDVVLGKMN